jgi:hypothetical protein
MTVCVATLFRWNYGLKGSPPGWGIAALAASDRMITAGDIEYEPQQLKFAFMTPHVLILIAGNYSIHSEALFETRKQIGTDMNIHPKNVALIYGGQIQAVNRRRAEDIFLAPLGLNTDSFIAQQRDLSDALVDRLTSQLQSYNSDEVESLVVGLDGRDAHIYLVDRRGTIHSLDDVGFGAIGMGAWHAKSQLMQAGYVNTVNFAPALAATYVAKHRAQIAPGVGMATDMRLITRLGIEPILPKVFAKIEEVHQSYERDRKTRADHAITELQEYIDSGDWKEDQTPEAKSVSDGRPTDATASTQSSEGARTNESQAPEQSSGT